MFHPIGSQPPVVYWRRRLLLIASAVALLVLVALTVNAVTSGNSGAAAAGSSTRSRTPPPSPTPSSPTAGSVRPPAGSTRAASTSAGPSRSPSSGSSTGSSGSSAGSSTGSASTAPAAPRVCTAKDVAVVAVPQQASYRVGDAPVMQMQVTDISGVACVQDLADRQVELKVYNGESRVWGSHDCKIEPGTALRTLTPKVPVLVAVSWSGLSSEPGCTATRQRVGAGTYTLYAALSGRVGRAGRFAIS